jgi:enoyl-CoA hydratase
MSGTVGVDRRGDVVIATIDVPDRRNAADLEIYHRLEAALALDAAAYVITGANGDFSAGDDVRMFQFDDLESSDRFIVDVTHIFQQIEAADRPVVAAVDGYALGFGFELALACDLIVATPRAVFGLPEIRHGAAPPNAMGRGPSVLGRGLIRHLALSGSHWLAGDEAHRYGMVAELHEPDDVVDAAVRLAAEMAACPSFLSSKRFLTADAEATYRMAPVVMAPLMATDAVAASQRRFAG